MRCDDNFIMLNEGESVGGSCSNTSIAARSIKLLSNASISAVSSIIPPLATFMICKFCLALLRKMIQQFLEF